jgi:hypothetical protein
MSNYDQPPDHLERWIERHVQALALRRAPQELPARVVAELQRRAASPWWRKSFLYWPVVARIAFAALCLELANASITLLRWLSAEPLSVEFSVMLSRPFTWTERLIEAVQRIQAFFELVLSHLPIPWLYGGLLAVVLMYIALFGIGAAAYRALYSDR